MPTNYDFDLISLGSGPAGQRAAVQAAKLGLRAAVIERSRVLGGVCVDTGTIPSKTFREAVRTFMGGNRWGMNYGGSGVQLRPTVEQLMSRVKDVMWKEGEVIENQLRRNDVAMLRGRGTLVDPHTVAVETERGRKVYTTDKIIIAVGTRPAPPPGESDPELVVTSDGMLSLRQLPRTMTVVGAGVIGMEYASMFAALGIPVTVVEKRDRPLEFLDGEILDELMHQMRNANVTFRMGEAVSRIEIQAGPPRRAALLLESGKRIVADLVLYSAGRMGAIEGLGLETVGLQADPRGRITVNENYQTAVPHIYAAGDVIGFPSLAATSSEQGRRAACHAFGVASAAMESHFPFGIYSIPEISMVGETEKQLTDKRVPYEIGLARYREIARGQILGDDTGLLKMIFHRENRRLLGVHAIGTSATELIHIGQAVLGLEGGLDYFLRTVFNYPTLAECYKVAALDAANRLAR